MQLEGLTVALRPRSPWEAADLGVALVRQHAARIWSAWVLITLPLCVLLTAFCIWIDLPLLAGFLMWWLKPVFDRIPLFVLSRAVFGATPSLRETLRAQWSWGWRGCLRWMHWRRLHPGRALLLSVDLLEGLRGPQRRQRCQVLARANVSPSVMLTVIGIHIETMLWASMILLGMMFVPIEFMSESARAIWENLFEAPPMWAEMLLALLQWLAMSIMEPIYVGAGFGLYLNRRTQLEAWDIELAFRRLAARLTQTAAVVLFGIAVLLNTGAAHAQDKEPPPPIDIEQLIESAENIDAGLKLSSTSVSTASGLEEVFSRQYRDDGGAFEQAVIETYKDPDLTGKKMVGSWRARHQDPDKPDASATPEWVQAIASVVAFLTEHGLWVLLAILVLVLIRHHALWLPWLSDRLVIERRLDATTTSDIVVPETLPDDVPATVRALWQAGQARAALALLYRAAVQRLIDALGAPLPPGATEAECLRQSRRLQDLGYAQLFARIVRSWQATAYAERAPSQQDFDRLLTDWQRPSEPTQ